MEVNKQESIVFKVLFFAREAHGEQFQKYGGALYINHPIAVATACMVMGGSLEMICASLLHDVIEDTSITDVELMNFLLSISEMTQESAIHIHSMVLDLTDVYTHEKYPGLNREKRKYLELIRIKKISEDAKFIKRCDLIDNAKSILRYDAGFYEGVFREEMQNCLDVMSGDNSKNKVRLSVIAARYIGHEIIDKKAKERWQTKQILYEYKEKIINHFLEGIGFEDFVDCLWTDYEYLDDPCGLTQTLAEYVSGFINGDIEKKFKEGIKDSINDSFNKVLDKLASEDKNDD